MTAREIITEVGEATGLCDQTKLLRRINRAVELLASKDLFNSLTGYLNFTVNGLSNFIALPREVRAVVNVNINNNPSINRSRFYEFDLNGPGTELGDGLDWQWADRCNVVIQDETKLPGVLSYRCVSSGDNGKTISVEGRDGTGRIITESLIAHATSPVAGSKTFYEVTRVVREETGSECLLYCAGNLIAQYYGDETEPNYRAIRLSRAAASVRIMFRREPLQITSLDTFIPLSSPMAVIQAAKAVGHLSSGEDEMADACLLRAQMFIKDDQASRAEGDKIATERQSPGILGYGLSNSEGIRVADVYDTASEIWPKVGKAVVLKKITQAVQTLLAKAHWDGLLGFVDLWPVSHQQDVNTYGKTGHGMYALPRFIGTPVKINICGTPTRPRNRWFEFHLNGTGEASLASVDTWDDMGEFPLMELIPRQPGTGIVMATKMIAICENGLDEGKSVRMYGREFDVAKNRVVEVWRDGSPGWTCPCVPTMRDPGAGAPLWIEVTRIERAETRGFVRLVSVVASPVAAIPATDVSTITTGFAITGTYSGVNLSTQVFGVFTSDQIKIYGDTGHTIQVGQSAVISGLDPSVATAVTYTISGMTFTGTIRRTSGSATNFTVTRTYTPGVAASTAYTAGRQFGLWYPDEISPSYRWIRLPGSHLKRIRVLYRKRFSRIASVFDQIPLRSSLSVENMLRAIKAQEMGLVDQSEPLELKAVQYLSEDRIKEGASQNPVLEFDTNTAGPGFENIA